MLLDASGLVGYWTFDAAANLGQDSSSRANDLTPFFGVAAEASGARGGAVRLDGVDDVLGLGEGEQPDDDGVPTGFPMGEASYSVSVWVRPEGDAAMGIVGWGGDGANGSNRLSLGVGNVVRAQWGGNELVADAATLTSIGADLRDGQWHHLATLFDGSARSLWVDGRLVVSDSPGAAAVAAENFRLGADGQGSQFDGSLDEIAVYSTVLTAGEVAALAAGAAADDVHVPGGALPSPAGYWSFDNPGDLGSDGGPLGNDLSPFGDAVTYSNQGRFDGALSLGGSQDYLALANGNVEITNAAPDGFPLGNSAYSVSAWIRPTFTGHRGIIGWGNYGNSRQVNAFRLFNDNGFRHYWWAADLDATDATVNARGINLDDGNWHHALVTFDGASSRQLWLDGIMLGQDVPGVNNAQGMRFRLGNTNGNENFYGLLDDVAVWDVGLSADEIRGLAEGTLRPVTPNTAPTTAVDAYVVDEDQVLDVAAAAGVLANDIDTDGDALSAIVASGPLHGRLVLRGDGSFRYVPDTDYWGADSFTYLASDGRESRIATVNLTVTAVYDPAVAVADQYVVAAGSALDVGTEQGVLANDENPDQVPLTAVLVDMPSAGSVDLDGDGSFQYVPEPGFQGLDSFTYRVDDSVGLSNVVQVNLAVDGPPVAVADAYDLTEDQVLDVSAASGVLSNDSDPDSDPLTARLDSPPQHGTLSLADDGSFRYTPVPDFFGTDSFTYAANDGDQDSDTVEVVITVTSVNDAPVAVTDEYLVIEGQLLSIASENGLLSNDIDVDGPSLSAHLVMAPTHGTLALNADGSFEYTPRGGYVGRDVFTYRVDDALVTSSPVSVILDVERADRQIVINEIHYEPDDKTRPGEFIELYHKGLVPVDLSGWSFSSGIDFTFPPGTTMEPGEYLLIAEDPSVIQTDFGIAAIGPWTGSLNNEGEEVDLRNASGQRVDRVDYGVGFPWPLDSAGNGPSIELVNPSLDNDLGGSWRAASQDTGQPTDPVFYLDAGQQWSYRKGTSEPPANWREPGFVEDATWLTGTTPIGYGDGDDATLLSDMQNNYSTVYLRNEFVIDQMPDVLELRVYVDDGAIVWLNGTEVARFYVSAGSKAYNDVTGLTDHERTWEDVLITNPAAYVHEGTNTIAIHSINASLGSSDLSIDASVLMPGSEGLPSRPTPGKQNSTYVANAPPQMRQVDHEPGMPGSGQPTVVTMKVTDPQGVGEVSLSYQVVLPGQYIPAFLPVPINQLIADADTPPLPNPEFEDPANWTTVMMVDDGTGGDEQAGDDVYTATLPGQINRTLVRYRVTASDNDGRSVRVPYRDDASLNFAYFVYDGVPEYNGHSVEVLESLPVYHFITRAEDMTQVLAYTGDQIPQGTQARFAYNWPGTMVYDGEVYDNIEYRLRGANGRYYNTGKRSMRFRFNEGNYFQARDQNGEPYQERWRTLTTGKGFDNRLTLTWALNEAISYHLYDQIGVPAADTHWTHFRVIDGADEAPDRWHGDFWGLNFVSETYDVRFLEAHDLEKGNLYKLINQTRDPLQQQRYQAVGAVTDGSDHDNIENNLVGSSTADYIDAHVNLEKYYLYHALAEAIRHYDYWPDANKNMVYYFEPDYLPENNDLGKLWILPWDTDASWGPTWNNGHDVVYNSIFPASGGGSDPNSTPELWPAYFNVVREIRDLLWQPDQINPLVDEFAAKIAAFIPADEDRWKGAPLSAGNYNGLGGQGMVSFDALVRDLKNFAFVGGNWPGGSVRSGGRAADLDVLQASNGEGGQIPSTPSISYSGQPDYPLDGLSFQTTTFLDPQGNGTFGAMEWRVAEITDPSAPAYDPEQPLLLEYNARWESGELTNFDQDVSVPATAVEVGHTYRARVRFQDDSGRWSHWSAPIEFTTTAPDNADAVTRYLRITEVMYNPPEPVPGQSSDDAQDYEYVELRNTGPLTLDLSQVQINDGVQYEFSGGDVTQLDPGQYLVVVKDRDAFVSRYGQGITIAGEFASGSLSNGGEELELTYGGDVTIHRFDYDDEAGWPVLADGYGASLEVIDTEGDYDDSGNWRAGADYGGSPGRAGTDRRDVVINEVLTHTDVPQLDFIELHNRSDEPVDVSGWWVSDSADDFFKYQLPEGSVIGPGQYLLLDESDFNSSMGVDPRDFALDGARGDEVFLLETDDEGDPIRFADHVQFGAAANGESIGRYPDGDGRMMPLLTPTDGATNSDPRIGPVVIREIMYHPAELDPTLADSLEFVELHNTGAAAESLTGWQLAGGIDFEFPDGTFIPADGVLIVTSFDPNDPVNTERLMTFRDTYGLDPAAPIVGGYSGRLDNGGESVLLSRPDEPPLDDPEFVPRLTEDFVDYDDTLPWPPLADGQGGSLVRVDPVAPGVYPSSWAADVPSPGSTGGPLQVVRVTVNGAETDPADRSSGAQPTSWQTQRSDIRSIVVVFNNSVDVTPEDLTLTNLGIDAPADPDTPINLTSEQLTVEGGRLTIRFGNLELPEGIYRLEIGSSVTDPQGNPLDGDRDGLPGGDYSLTGSLDNGFFKLHGNWNDDEGVSIFDFTTFAYWFGVPVPSAPAYIDLSDDLGVSIFDFTLFASNFGRSVTFPSPLVGRGELSGALPPVSFDTFSRLAAVDSRASRVERRATDGRAGEPGQERLPTSEDRGGLDLARRPSKGIDDTGPPDDERRDSWEDSWLDDELLEDIALDVASLAGVRPGILNDN